VDLSGFRPDERTALPSAGRELRAQMQEAGQLEPFETVAPEPQEVPYRASKEAISEAVDNVLFGATGAEKDEAAAQKFLQSVQQRVFDVEQAVKRSAWKGAKEGPPALDMIKTVGSRTGAKIGPTSELKVELKLFEAGPIKRAIEEIEGTDIARVVDVGALNDLRFLTRPQKFEVRWSPSVPYGAKAPRAAKNSEGWVGAIQDRSGMTLDVVKGTRDDVERKLTDALQKYNAEIADDVVTRLREYSRTVESLGAERAETIEAGRAQLSFADLPAPAAASAAEPTALTGRLEFSRGAGELASARAAAKEDARAARVAADIEARRDAVRRGGLPPERVGPETPAGLVLAGQAPRVSAEQMAAVESLLQDRAAQLGRNLTPAEVDEVVSRGLQLPGGSLSMPMLPAPPLPSGAADSIARDVLVAERNVNRAAAADRGLQLPAGQAARAQLSPAEAEALAVAEQERQLGQVRMGRNIAATSELQAAVEAQRAGVPAERAIQGQGPQGLRLGGGAPPQGLPSMALPPGRAPFPALPAAEGAAGALPAAEGAVGALPAGGLSGGAGAAGVAPEAAAAAMGAARAGGGAAGRGLALPGMTPEMSLVAQGAVMGAAGEAQQQQLGLSQGGPEAILAAAFVGGGIPFGIHALQRGFGATSKLIAGAVDGNGVPFGEKFARAAGRMEETAMLRMFGMSKANIRELNALFGRSEEDLRGTRKFVDFIKASFADIERLKQEFPENATLQSIRTDSFLKFGNLKPEQRVAFAQALQNSAGRAVESIYSPFYQVQIPSSEIAAVARRVRQKLVGQGALGEIPLESIRAELNALTSFINQGGTHTVGSLRNFENNISRIFRENAGVGKPFTDAQKLLRDEVKALYVNAVDAVSPGAREALPLMNEAYTMAERLSKGALDKEATLAAQSALGPDNLNAAVLGAAGLGQFASALRYLIGAVAVRGFYNQRADGFIADMAQRLGAGAVKMQTNPRVAAQVASRSMIDASRPVMLGLSAQNFTSTTPQDYSDLTEAVRQMGRDREAIAQRMKGAVSNLPPEEQAAALQKVDRIFQALGDNLPQNIEEPGKVSEQARRYTVFARALLDRAYATQVLANGNQDSALAAEALRAQGEDGQKYIDALEEDLRTSINRDRKLQEDQQLLAAHRAIKSHSSKAGIRIGGAGRMGAGRMGAAIHGGLKLPKLPGGGTNPLSAAQMGRTVNAFMGSSGLKQ
jgi:hypothetical protein